MAVEWMLGAFGGAKALGLPDAAVGLLDKALKACAGAEGKKVLDQVKARLRAYSGSAPVNDDLDRAIRLAELTAGLMLVDRFRRQVDLEILETRGATPPPFIDKARSHLFDQIGLCPGFQVKPNALLIREIEAGLDRALAEPAAVEQAMSAAAARAFADLTAVSGTAPEDFETWYFGRRDGEPGWAILAVAFLRETLKAKPAVETEFVLSRLAGVRESLRGFASKLDAIKDDTGAIREDTGEIRTEVGAVRSEVAEIRDLLRQAGMIKRAAKEGISEAAVWATVEWLGGEGIARDDLIPWLEDWIEKAQGALGRHSNEGEAFEAARQEAERRFSQGLLSEASGAFMEELVRDEQREAERQEERQRQRLRLLEEAIRFDELAFDGEAAAAKLRKMAEIEGVTGADALGRWLFDKAMKFYERGEQKGDNPALLVAIAAYRAALEERTREHVPLDWAATQNNLGNALRTLGERESGIVRLKEAVVAFRAALEERTRERVPLDWAMTQNNLGTALSRLGERESGTARLTEAVAAFRAALQEYARKWVSLEWATTQNNLGHALRMLGERESGTVRLTEAVAAFRAALEERTHERVPLDWAMTQNNLGTALATLGARECDTALLDEAVVAFRAALEEGTLERVPLQWATTQNNLGNALSELGKRESGTERLEDAVAAYRAALEEHTRGRVPLDWATTQNNLGTALRALGARESGTARLTEAVGAHRAALEEWTRERVPLRWAATQNNLGNALKTLGARESGTEQLTEAVAAYRAALEEFTEEHAPLQRQGTQANLAGAEALLAERRAGGFS